MFSNIFFQPAKKKINFSELVSLRNYGLHVVYFHIKIWFSFYLIVKKKYIESLHVNHNPAYLINCLKSFWRFFTNSVKDHQICNIWESNLGIRGGGISIIFITDFFNMGIIWYQKNENKMFQCQGQVCLLLYLVLYECPSCELFACFTVWYIDRDRSFVDYSSVSFCETKSEGEQSHDSLLSCWFHFKLIHLETILLVCSLCVEWG